MLQPPRPEDVAEAVQMLVTARHPAILCGLGAAERKAESEVRKLAEYLGAPVATSLYAAGLCAKYPLYLGISGGLGSELTVDALAESDALIVVGASLNEWTTHFGKILENGKKIIQIDERQEAFGWFAPRFPSVWKPMLTQPSPHSRGAEARRQTSPSARGRDSTENQGWKPPAINYEDGKFVDPRRAAAYIEDKLPKRDRILVFDGGHAAMVTVADPKQPER